MPRPTDIARKERTDDRIEEYKQVLLECGLKDTLACEKMGIGRQAVQHWRKTRPDFDEWYKEHHLRLTQLMEKEWEKWAMAGLHNASPQALRDILRRRHDSEYCDRQGGVGTFFVKVERALTPVPDQAQLPEGAVDGEYSEAP